MSQQTKEVIVAVDFGTTFSGVAWAQVSNPDAQYIINQWSYDTSGGIGGMTSEKVPSELAYKYEGSTPVPVWGFQIPDSMPRLQFLKLELESEQKIDLRSLHRNNMSLECKDSRRMDYPYHATPESAIIDYLQALLNHITEVMKDQVGTAFESMKLTYVITVPAIWSDRAKRTTLECADKAGMSASHIISEPEAAAIHTLKASNPHGMSVGDTIMVCDAGGGTVDLITFTILEFEPSLRLKEEAPGNGALCGGTFLNRKFEGFLQEKLGLCDGWGYDTMDHAMQRFETVVKRQFHGDPKEMFAFPVPGIANNETLGVRRGCLQVSGEEINKLCLPVLEKVVDLVKHQMDISRKTVKSIFLVARFFVHTCESICPPSIQILAPVDGWTAVVRGALSKVVSTISSLVSPIAIDSRVARKSYGNSKSVKFNPRKHNHGQKYWSAFEGHYRIDVMHWIIKKGDDIFESQPIVMKWCRQRLKRKGTFTDVKQEIYEIETPDGVDPPMYFSGETMKLHTVLHPQLDSILCQQIPRVHGADNEMYYDVAYEVHAVYYSAHCEYSLWFAGKNHGAVRVDYV
ncbi:actin-like ATPase domain-containing protein [Penicillium brevicompactum]|uniref:actin-like ATPase domain-containing protein n=1 Tax=Penicillium brevicompactum TaxID=5074 RepID=UPI002541BC4E|nr:actin-like ATPase domain-containing protein [Penicillium brevicompactum]KAJ5347113.1 actin-like ATPase domain-containing protein [Penicillium brevicompactum]